MNSHDVSDVTLAIPAGIATVLQRPTAERRLTVHRMTNLQDLAGIVDEWRKLDATTTPRTPFTSPDWILLWWKHFSRSNLLFKDEFFGHVVRERGGRLIAIAPLMRTFCPGRGVAVMRIVQFFGTDPSLTEFRGVICSLEDHDRVVRTLTEHFLAYSDMWDILRWNGLRQPIAAYQAGISTGKFLCERELRDYIIELPATWDGLKARVSSNMRKNLRKAYEFLERDGLPFSCRVVSEPGDVEAALGRFLTLHSARAGAADMVPHPNKFGQPHCRAFLSDYLRIMAEAGQLTLFEMEIGGKTVASRLGFRVGDVLYMYFAGHDPVWRRYSVMTVLMTEMIRWALANGIRDVNLSTGSDQSKLRWKPVEIVLHEAAQVAPTRRARVAALSFRAYQFLWSLWARVSAGRGMRDEPTHLAMAGEQVAYAKLSAGRKAGRKPD